MAPLQTKTNFQTTPALTIAATFDLNVAVGGVLLAITDSDTSGTFSGVAGGGTWVKAVGQIWNFSQHDSDVWICVSATGGATTVTATVSIAGNNSLVILEYPAMIGSPLDKTASAQSGDGTNSTPADSGNTALTTQASELLFGAVVAFGTALTEANGFTARASVTNTTSGVIVTASDLTVSATGTYKIQESLTAAQWAALIATLKLAPVSGRISKANALKPSPFAPGSSPLNQLRRF